MPYQMKSGKWRAKKMINGELRTRVFPTKTEAKKWEAEQTAEAWQEAESPIPTVCWLDFASAYLKMSEERFSAKTLGEKKLAFRHSLKVIPPEKPARDVTIAECLATLRLVAQHSSGNAANKVRKNLGAAWAWGHKYYGLPNLNPFLEVEKFPADQTPRYVPSESDFWKVYNVANAQDKVFLLFLLHTGARIGEVFRLTWADVDLAEGRVRLGTRKTRDGGMKYAWLPMTEMLTEALAEYKRDYGNTPLVFTQYGRGEQYTHRQHLMKNLCTRAGVKPFGFHAIRHLAATILAYAKLDLPTVQAMLRHSSPTTTACYIKSLGIDREKIEAAFSKGEGAKIIAFAPPKKAIGT